MRNLGEIIADLDGVYVCLEHPEHAPERRIRAARDGLEPLIAELREKWEEIRLLEPPAPDVTLAALSAPQRGAILAGRWHVNYEMTPTASVGRVIAESAIGRPLGVVYETRGVDTLAAVEPDVLVQAQFVHFLGTDAGRTWLYTL